MTNISSKLARVVSGGVALLGMVMMMPVALAFTNSTITNLTITPDPFYGQIPGHENVSKVNIDYDWNSGGYSAGNVTEVIKDSHGVVVYYWGATLGADARTGSANFAVPIILTWDGKANTGNRSGQYLPDGTYTFDVISHVATGPDTEAAKTFKMIKTIAPVISWASQPAGVYYTGSGGYVLNFHLVRNTGPSVATDVVIHGPINNNPQDFTTGVLKNTDGDFSLIWNGQINGAPATPGQYTYSLKAHTIISSFEVYSNELTGNFMVSAGTAPTPTVSGLTATPTTYNPNSGNMTFGYSLAGSAGNTSVKTGVYSTDGTVTVKTWDFSNQSTGSNTIVWDGKDGNGNPVGNGSYIFKVWGTDGSFSVVPAQTSFVVNVASTPVDSTHCAGFSDLGASDSDCAAFQYVKSIGAMTGNPDGTFSPESSLQRDQIAKIVLETFNKYNSGTNYCNGTNPFPDVTSSSWAFQYICRGVNLSIITGYQAGADAGFYRPARAVNRVEFLALLLRNLTDTMPANTVSSYADVPLNQWYTGYAKYAKDHDLFIGVSLYGTAETTRREVAEVIYKLHTEGKI